MIGDERYIPVNLAELDSFGNTSFALSADRAPSRVCPTNTFFPYSDMLLQYTTAFSAIVSCLNSFLYSKKIPTAPYNTTILHYSTSTTLHYYYTSWCWMSCANCIANFLCSAKNTTNPLCINLLKTLLLCCCGARGGVPTATWRGVPQGVYLA